ncbi:hypothetical protein [Marilutibacter chinensis]|uniref:Secreted protein n=1 Tax=Marilutibacter chinensis TaxID=2912247 RepID=A0ABS9HUZ3_9GAMM|nr:hypothetical protein [Lysobacter chinensis]MCF7221975.1 hypothetical protein [Lysobacter chinensis]
MMRPLSFRTLALIGCLAFGPLAFAQQPPAQQPATADQPIQQQMSAEEFEAAGLDKLSAEELANLNRWLGRKIETETALAAAAAKKKVEDDNRGFLSFGSEEPVVGTVTSEFRGFGKGRRYTLDNGQVWEQIDNASLVGARNPNPKATIRPSLVGNTWYMSVEGYNTRAKVKRVE